MNISEIQQSSIKMNSKLMVCLLVLAVLAVSLPTAQANCNSVGGHRVVIDDRCTDLNNGDDKIGCNAGGQGQSCRFCGAIGERVC
jgi:hypothetical protein